MSMPMLALGKEKKHSTLPLQHKAPGMQI